MNNNNHIAPTSQQPAAVRPVEDAKEESTVADVVPEEPSSNRRIAKNALMLYIRMFLTMIVGLYTSRVVLATLGVEDYGIYGVVGGVVAMMGFLNASMSGATSRFLTFELGRGNKKRMADTFSSALIVHIGIAVIVFILAETIGLWFLCNKLVIPEERMTAAHWVYQCSIASTMLGITQVPYNASIIAHEKMDTYAYVEIFNVSLKLLFVYLLVIGNIDKLKLYAVLMLAGSFIVITVYRVYCIRRFSETHFQWIWDKSILKPLLSFSGWDLYGNMAWSVRQQGANFILNVFYGPTINAASGIASTVQGVLFGFSSNVVTAFKPPIIKQYAANEFDNMNSLLRYGSKIAVLLLLVFSLPVLLKTEYVLGLWLKEVPRDAVFMTQMSLIMNLFSCFNSIVIVGIHASGRMATTGLVCGTIYLLSLPVMYLILRLGFTYRECYILFVIITALFCFINILILKHHVPQFKSFRFLYSSAIPMIIVSIATFIITKQVVRYISINNELIELLFMTSICLTLLLLLSYVLAFSKQERARINKKLLKWVRLRN